MKTGSKKLLRVFAIVGMLALIFLWPPRYRLGRLDEIKIDDILSYKIKAIALRDGGSYKGALTDESYLQNVSWLTAVHPKKYPIKFRLVFECSRYEPNDFIIDPSVFRQMLLALKKGEYMGNTLTAFEDILCFDYTLGKAVCLPCDIRYDEKTVYVSQWASKELYKLLADANIVSEHGIVTPPKGSHAKDATSPEMNILPKRGANSAK